MTSKFKIGGLDAHPTKGYRGFARPGKANSRRKLIRVGALICRKSNASNRLERSGGRWPKIPLAERRAMKVKGWS